MNENNKESALQSEELEVSLPNQKGCLCESCIFAGENGWRTTKCKKYITERKPFNVMFKSAPCEFYKEK